VVEKVFFKVKLHINYVYTIGVVIISMVENDLCEVFSLCEFVFFKTKKRFARKPQG